MAHMSTAVRFPLHSTVLDNGMRVVVNPDPTVPVVAVNLWFDVGSRDEQPGRTGLAHLFEHLMFEGSANVAAGELEVLLPEHPGELTPVTLVCPHRKQLSAGVRLLYEAVKACCEGQSAG